MGSTPSTPNGEGNNGDPWSSIENINFSLNVQVNNEGNHQPPLNNNNNLSPTTTSSTTTTAASSSSSSLLLLNKNNCENSISENILDSIKMENLNDSETKKDNDSKKMISDGSDNNNVATNSDDNITIENTDNINVNKIEIETKKLQTLEEFKEELRIKRETRQNAIADLRQKLTELTEQLTIEKKLNKKLMLHMKKNDINITDISIDHDDDDDDNIVLDVDTNTDSSKNNIQIKSELAEMQLALQMANSEILTLTNELQESKKHIGSLKEVIVVSKQMISIREQQVNQLKGKLTEIEDSLADRETVLLSENLKIEYERQLTNIRNLKNLYEERARVSDRDKVSLTRQLEAKNRELLTEQEKSQKLEERNSALEEELTNLRNELTTNKENLAEYKSENKELQGEMDVINQLCSQMIMGFNGGNDINIDKLTNMLEDNRDLLQNITNRETSTEVAASLPKLLFDIVSDADNTNTNNLNTNTLVLEENKSQLNVENVDEMKGKCKITTVQEIIHNLPKVYKVLIELLNHQKVEQVVLLPENNKSEDCYKSVQTSSGTELVLSVSKTYIKLKDLILEKKFLQKETHKLKHLNCHLEQRLGEQEKRLSTVTVELNKTWNLVGRMQRQHRQLHTNEQVLRYQLQQKRRMLTELKEELERCRRMWTLAREKNNESQNQWDRLRLEFSNRKLQDVNNSAESGYSDDPLSDDDDDNDDNTDVNNDNKKSIKSIASKSTISDVAAPTITSNKLVNITTPSKQFKRLQSVSPQRNNSNDNKNLPKRGNSAPPTINIISQIYQITSEMVPQSVELQNAILHNNYVKENIGNYAAATSTVYQPKHKSVINHIEVNDKNVIATESTAGSNIKKINLEKCQPSTSSSSSTLPHKDDVSRARLSRDCRVKFSKQRNDETLEEMFLRISNNQTNKNDVITTDNTPTNDLELNSANNNSSSIHDIDEIDNIVLNPIENANDLNNEIHNLSVDQEIFLINDDVQIIDNNQNNVSDNNENSSNNNSSVHDSDDTINSNIDTENIALNPIEIANEVIHDLSVDQENSLINNVVQTIDSYENNLSADNNESSTLSSSSTIVPSTELSTVNHENNITPTFTPTADSSLPSEASSSSSASSSLSFLTSTEQTYLQRRAERLLRLEEQSAQLMTRMTQSANRANNITYQLDELHSHYGRINNNDDADDDEGNIESNNVTNNQENNETNDNDNVD